VSRQSSNLLLFNWLVIWGFSVSGHHTGVVLGCGSIYNHSAEPNLGYRRVRVDASSEAVQGLSVPRWVFQPTGSLEMGRFGTRKSEPSHRDGWVSEKGIIYIYIYVPLRSLSMSQSVTGDKTFTGGVLFKERQR